MSKVDFPVSLDSYFFTKTHVDSIPGHDPTKPGVALLPDNNISLNEIPNEPQVFQVAMRTLINAERDPKYPYFIDMECVAFLRVVETLPPDEARRGDVSAIMASLRRHTQYKPITANVGTHTGRAGEVLAGNHTLMAFRELAEAEPDDPRWRKMLVHWVDVDDDMAERIVVADNRTGQLGGYDEAQLAELLAGFDGDLDGLGFTDADVEALLALNDPDAGGDGPGGDGNGNTPPSVPLAGTRGRSTLQESTIRPSTSATP